MKGLLIKDAKLMFLQGKTLLMAVVLVSVFLGLFGDGGASFMVAYITFIFSMFTATTISYDEFDNCSLFLLSLPVTRKSYVNEKYVFGLITTAVSWCIAMAAGTLVLIAGGNRPDPVDWIGSGVIYIFLAWIFLSVMIPLRLKFDVEKARYVNMIVIGGILLLAFFAGGIARYIPAEKVKEVERFVSGIGNGGFVVAGACVSLILAAVSYFCSRKIIDKKEF